MRRTTRLSRKEIERMRVVRRVHPLNPNAIRLTRSIGDRCGLTQIGVHLVEVPPGRESTEAHAHVFEDECTYILAGNGRVVAGDSDRAVRAGDFIAYPRGGPAHKLVNDGTVNLRYLLVGQRLRHDVVDYPRVRKRLYKNGDELNLVDRAAVVVPRPYASSIVTPDGLPSSRRPLPPRTTATKRTRRAAS